MNDALPVFRFDTDAALERALEDAAVRVIRSGRYMLGAEVEGFEREFAAFCGIAHCIGVANGTDALEIALRAVGVGRGDRVVTAANAGYYASTAIRAIGAEPVYVDVGSRLVMTAETCDPALADARAVLVTHLYGHAAPVDEIAAAARAVGVPVIEDCAQAHGATRRGRGVGTIGTAGCFSFYPTKNLGALGDAGAIVTGDAALASRVRSLRQYGWGKKYSVDREGGRNSRLDEMQAAFLRVKLPYLSHWNATRLRIARRYREGLRDLPLQSTEWCEGEYVAHLVVVRSGDRDALRADLASCGIATDVHYPLPDHLQPVENREHALRLPVAEAACREVLTLPCFPGMTDAEVDRVVVAIRAHYGSRRGP